MRPTGSHPGCSQPLVLRGGGGALVLLLVALLALVSIHTDRELGKAAAFSSSLAAAGCSTRVLVCRVPPANHDGRNSTCRAVEWKRGSDGGHPSLRATSAGGIEGWAAGAEAAVGTSEGNGTAVEQQPHEQFTVRVCPSFARNEVAVRVLHHHHSRQQQQSAKGECGEAFIETMLDGPERRLQRLSFVGSGSSSGSKACEYGAVMPIGKAGEYSVEVSVVHTGESGGMDPYRNYVLWRDRHTFEGRGRVDEKGRWVRRAGNMNSNSSETEGMGYRCPVGGEGVAGYEWVEGARDAPAAAAAGVESAEAAQGCVRRLTPRAKIVFMGDSFSRQVWMDGMWIGDGVWLCGWSVGEFMMECRDVGCRLGEVNDSTLPFPSDNRRSTGWRGCSAWTR